MSLSSTTRGNNSTMKCIKMWWYEYMDRFVKLFIIFELLLLAVDRSILHYLLYIMLPIFYNGNCARSTKRATEFRCQQFHLSRFVHNIMLRFILSCTTTNALHIHVCPAWKQARLFRYGYILLTISNTVAIAIQFLNWEGANWKWQERQMNEILMDAITLILSLPVQLSYWSFQLFILFSVAKRSNLCRMPYMGHVRLVAQNQQL